MASADTSKPTCPVCHQADQVKTTESAYSTGIARCAPPDMPVRKVPMLSYITACIILIGICVFLIIVFIGGAEYSFPWQAQAVLLGVTIISIITVLSISYYAFQRVVRGDNEATVLFPAWDKAMATWKSLYYCSRDNVIFDPRADSVVTDDQLTQLREFNEQSQPVASALASH